MKIMRNILLPFIGLVIAWVPIFLFVHFGIMHLNGILPGIFDLPSLLLTYGGAFVCLFVLHKPSPILNAFEHLCSSQNPETLKQSLRIARNWGISFILCGFFLSTWGITQMYRNLSDPAAIPPSMALAYLSTFYGLQFAVVFAFPAYLIIEKRMSDSKLSLNQFE